MKALVYEGVEKVIWRDFDDPDNSHINDAQNGDNDDVLLRIDAVNICGSDMHAYFGHDDRRPAPLILGHEASATIIKGKNKGARVTINPLVSCGHCQYCQMGRENICVNREIISLPPRQGAFAEYLVMPFKNLVEIPDNISSEKAALCEPIACGWHGVKLAEKTLNQSFNDTGCLILGGGAIGLAFAVGLAHKGARNIAIFEPNPLRCAYIQENYDFQVLNSLDGVGRHYPLVMDGFGGNKSRAAACNHVCPGGVIIHTGLHDNSGGLDARYMTLQEVTFIGTYTYTMAHFKETAALIFSGAFGDLPWAEIRPLKDGDKAFKELALGKIATPKITLIP